ncbi:GrpB family protein [uncultured Maricaulis sp.]|uniref:GrpB family protein n=1 Tax=uncultured Maricaulis sp. TaxID=174710 RepID=UPI0026351CB8|nr:GrpB family protein [uncultured Maricaulis sp.]
MAVTVRAYDETWPQRFEVERARLSALLGGSVSRIEHIGSTSVPGLAAKPIIDILVGTDRLDRLDACNAAMRAAGYQVKGEYGLPGRRYFRRDAANGVRLVHIHAYQTESDGFRRHLVFRDYLRAHPDEAARYGDHKLGLAGSGALDGAGYQSAKSAMVEQIEVRALLWVRERDQKA